MQPPPAPDVLHQDVSVPTSYGAAYNLFSSTKELLIKTSSCTDTKASVTAGNGDATLYVYKEGYYWTGSTWQKLTFTGSSALISNLWYAGTANASVPMTTGNSERYYVGYICQKIGDIWKCGCSNTTCATAAWQLQKATKTNDNNAGGAVCGNNVCESGETTTSCPADCSGSSGGACDVPKNDLFKNPFNKNSAHHRPIGSGAIYAGDTDATTVAWKRGSRIYINIGKNWGSVFTQSQASDPTVTVRDDGMYNGLGLPVTMKIAPGSGGATSDSGADVYESSTGTLHEFFRLIASGSGYTAAIRRPTTIRGLGHGSSPQAGVTASGISLVVGLLRGFEANTAGYKIQHVLNLAVPSRPGDMGGVQMLSREINWPANNRDGFCSVGSNCNGPIPYGALLAIPPESKGGPNLDSLGLSEPGRRVAQALRDYGAYVMDTSGGVTMRADQTLTSGVSSQIRGDLAKVYKYLRVVKNNNASDTAAGGGTPLAPNCAFDVQ